MSEQQQLIKESLGRLLADICVPGVVDKAEAGIFPAQLWQTLNETGLTSASIPEEFGGSGGDPDDSLVVLWEAAKFAAPVPLAEHFIAGTLLAEQGASIGSEPVTIALGEFTVDQALRLQGRATNVAFARWCEQVVLVATSDTGARLCRVNLADVTVEPGVSVAGEPRDTIDIDVVLNLDDVFAVDDSIEQKISLLGAATRCVMMAGALESILEMTVAYSLDRSQFGRPISKFQAIQQQLAILAGEVAASMTASHSICSSFHKMDPMDIAIGKSRIGEAVSSCTDIAHQVHGAMGYTMEHSLNHRTRRLWAWREEYGNERAWQVFIGRTFLQDGADNLWNKVTSCR
jgi:acyl-CoA dehydrogenase